MCFTEVLEGKKPNNLNEDKVNKLMSLSSLTGKLKNVENIAKAIIDSTCGKVLAAEMKNFKYMPDHIAKTAEVNIFAEQCAQACGSHQIFKPINNGATPSGIVETPLANVARHVVPNTAPMLTKSELIGIQDKLGDTSKMLQGP
jgi:hypothetical protein